MFLHWKPGEDIEVRDSLADAIRVYARELYDRLMEAADVVEKLVGSGWECSLALYSVECFKDVDLESARRELTGLGLEHLVDQVEFEEEAEEE